MDDRMEGLDDRHNLDDLDDRHDLEGLDDLDDLVDEILEQIDLDDQNHLVHQDEQKLLDYITRNIDIWGLKDVFQDGSDYSLIEVIQRIQRIPRVPQVKSDDTIFKMDEDEPIVLPPVVKSITRYTPSTGRRTLNQREGSDGGSPCKSNQSLSLSSWSDRPSDHLLAQK